MDTVWAVEMVPLYTQWYCCSVFRNPSHQSAHVFSLTFCVQNSLNWEISEELFNCAHCTTHSLTTDSCLILWKMSHRFCNNGMLLNLFQKGKNVYLFGKDNQVTAKFQRALHSPKPHRILLTLAQALNFDAVWNLFIRSAADDPSYVRRWEEREMKGEEKKAGRRVREGERREMIKM